MIDELIDGSGFLVFKNQFPSRTIKRALKISSSFKQDTWGATRRLLDKDPVFETIATHPRILQIASSTLGKGFRLSNFSARIIHPAQAEDSNHRLTMQPHRDHPYRSEEQTEYAPSALASTGTVSLQVLVTLTEFTEQNGATAFLPGSQIGSASINFELFELKHKRFIAPAGTIGIWPAKLIHSAMPNKSDALRAALTFQYVSDFVKPYEDFKGEYTNSKGETSLSPKMRELVGLDDVFPFNYKQPAMA